jgi:acyl dehydratase
VSRYFEDFTVGERIATYGRTITDGDHSLFCALVGYHVPLFIDEEYAKKTRFGGRICPSSLIMSISTAMTESLFRTTVIAQTAADNGRFFHPVRPRDTGSPRSGVVVFRDHVLNQRDETVFQIDKTVKLARRPAS